MLRLYDNHLSGNGYQPRLLLAHLGQTYVPMDPAPTGVVNPVG